MSLSHTIALCFSCTQTHRKPPVELIASQYERAEGIYLTLDHFLEITVLNCDTYLLKLPSPVGVLTLGNVKYPSPPHLFWPRLSSSHSQKYSCRVGRFIFFFFTSLNALIKPSDHLGRDKEVKPSASLKLASIALCSTITVAATEVLSLDA